MKNINTQRNSNWLELVNPQINNFWSGLWNHGTIEPTRILQDHELVIVTSGSCKIQIDSQSFVLNAGEYIIIPPGKPHISRVTEENVQRYCIHFDWIIQATSYHKTHYIFGTKIPVDFKIKQAPSFVPEGLFSGSMPEDNQIQALLASFVSNWKLGDQVNIGICRGILLQILYSLLLHGSKEKARTFLTARNLAYDIKEKLDSAPHEILSIKEILQDMRYSYEHMMRIFTSEFGISPLQYLNRTRIERAKLLLREKELNVAEVADKVGFNDCAYFVRFFRKHTNMTPGQFARGQ